ncbi:ABC transporter substrate-binding protein [Candidatus Babeliales bacterium]|nr:ABC transporter substrate-binding protein [Candidatus Babeliales bacterium]
MKYIATFLSVFFISMLENIQSETILDKNQLDSIMNKPAFIKKNNFYEFSLGSSLPLVGGISIIGKDFSNGLNMAFNVFNKGASRHGKIIRLYSLDDHYSQIQGRRNIESLQKKGISTITGILQDKVIGLFETNLTHSNMGLWFSLSGTQDLYKKKYPLVINYRASLKREAKGLVKYVVKQRLLENIVVFYEESQWGKDGLAYVEKYLKKMGLDLRNAFSYPINTVLVDDAVTSIVRVQPMAVICIAHARPTYNLIQEVLSHGLEHCHFFGFSAVAPIQHLLKKSRGIDIAMSMVVPDPFFSQLEIAKKYRDDMQKFFPYVSLSPFSFEGYIAGKLTTHTLKNADKKATYAGVIKGFESIRNSLFGGLDLHFNSKKRSLSSAVWIKEMPEKEAIKILS